MELISQLRIGVEGRGAVAFGVLQLSSERLEFGGLIGVGSCELSDLQK